MVFRGENDRRIDQASLALSAFSYSFFRTRSFRIHHGFVTSSCTGGTVGINAYRARAADRRINLSHRTIGLGAPFHNHVSAAHSSFFRGGSAV